MNDQTKNLGKLPFNCERGFTQIPNAVNLHYQFYPKFNGNTVSVYTQIISHYNAEEGYAWPTHIQLAMALNMTEKTVGNHLKLLAKVGLINIHKSNGRFANQSYTLNKPIENEVEFYTMYPEAAEAKRISTEKLTGIKAEKDTRKTEMIAQYDAKESAELDEYADFS